MNAVFRKELMDMLRDKRVRSTAFFGPIFLVFFLLFVFGSVFGGIADSGKKPSKTQVGVIVNSASEGLLQRAGFRTMPFPNEAALKTGVQGGKPSVGVVDAPPVAGVTNLRVLFDESEQLSQIAVGRVNAALDAVNAKALDAYLKTTGAPAAETRPLAVKSENVGVGSSKGGADFLVGIMPYLIVIWAFYGGMSSASDLVAGEKERATLETLLISPVSRTAIVTGKLLALGAICLASSLASLVGLGAYIALKPPGSDLILSGGLTLAPVTVLVCVAVLLPLVAMFASLLLAVSTVAKNTREAQSYIGLASLVVVMPAMFSQFIGLTDYAKAAWVNLVPILNAAQQLRLALMGKPDFAGVAMTVASSLLLAAIAAAVSIRLFRREEVLTRV